KAVSALMSGWMPFGFEEPANRRAHLVSTPPIMSVVANQQRILIALLTQVRRHWRRDRNLPARIQALLSRNRSFGSRDRRLYRELVYTTLRFLPWIESALDHDPDHAARLIAWL